MPEGGYFTTASDHEKLIAQLKGPHDGALPSGNGVQALNLLRLAELTGRRELAERAERTIRALGGLVNRFPQAFSTLLLAVDWLAVGPREIVLAGDPSAALRAMLRTLPARRSRRSASSLWPVPARTLTSFRSWPGRTPGPRGRAPTSAATGPAARPSRMPRR